MLKPRERDLFLSIVDLLASNATTLRARVVVGGFAVTVSDVLFETAARGAGHKLPSMVGDMIVALYTLDDAPRTYEAAAKVILLGHPALELRRAEQAEEAAMAAAEAEMEQRRISAERKRQAAGLPPVRIGRPRKTAESRKNSAANRSAARAKRAA